MVKLNGDLSSQVFIKTGSAVFCLTNDLKYSTVFECHFQKKDIG